MSNFARAMSLRCSEKGIYVAEFEAAFAEAFGARHAISCCNGTATMHVALVALGVKPGDVVAVPPLTYASTTLAVLCAGAQVRYVDVDPRTWNMVPTEGYQIPVSLFGLWSGSIASVAVDDAAETANPHRPEVAFTSYSLENSKILGIGEGGVLLTNDEELAWKARQFRCVGYHRGGPEDETLMHPSRDPLAVRHDVIGWNYLMSDLQAVAGLERLGQREALITERRAAAMCYRDVVQTCDWLTPQHVPSGYPHTWWTYGVALDSADLWRPLAKAVVKHGGEMPRGCFRLTYQEPAFRHLAPDGTCPVAERLQPRLMLFQTNDVASAMTNSRALARAIEEIG